MKNTMTNKQLCFIAAVLFTLFLITAIRFQEFPRHRRPPITYNIDKGVWKTLPSLELAVRMNSNPAAVTVYKEWFLRSLQLFWPDEWVYLTVILDDENPLDHVVGKNLSHLWPGPKIVYLGPGNSSIYQDNQRRRMFLDYFYPERYVSAEYVGFADSDTMFTTVMGRVQFSGRRSQGNKIIVNNNTIAY